MGCSLRGRERGFGNQGIENLQDVWLTSQFLDSCSAAKILFEAESHRGAEREKMIKTKKHGYKANSLFRHGLDTVRRLFRKDAH